MGAVLGFNTQLYVATCTCGGTYAISEEYRAHCQTLGGKKEWHCPYCQARWSYGKSEADQLKAQLEAAQQKVRDAERLKDQAETAAAKAQGKAKRAETALKRTQLHVHNGVRPVEGCHRTFTRLAAHMSRMHPEYSK